MRVCDRHPRTVASDFIAIQSTDERIDLCPSCTRLIRQWVSDTKQEEIDKPQTKWGKKIPA